MKFHFYILSYIFIDILYNMCYNKRGNININIMGYCKLFYLNAFIVIYSFNKMFFNKITIYQQVFPSLASLGTVLIIYIPQLGLRPRSFIYIIRIREIIIYIKCVFFFAYLYTGDGGRQKMLHFFTAFFR